MSLSGVMPRTHSSSCTPVAPQANPRQVCVCMRVCMCVRKGEKQVSKEAWNDQQKQLEQVLGIRVIMDDSDTQSKNVSGQYTYVTSGCDKGD